MILIMCWSEERILHTFMFWCMINATFRFFSIVTAEEDEEIFIGEDQTDEKLHQLKHREVFLSRQLEIINANTIRFCIIQYLSCWLLIYCFLNKICVLILAISNLCYKWCIEISCLNLDLTLITTGRYILKLL